ncbi:MAG: beta-aspartyl-peptidase [Bacteroidales bacterium]|nr:beta-aspartyl-peptidase [Bacteroidales bacterium]
MMYLFKNCEIYAPDYLGKKDVLVGGQKILAIEDHLEVPAGWDIDVIDGTGLKMIPGLIDSHVHIAGAGGEGGPASRTPEMQLSQMIEAGITTVVGCLGADGMTRSVESVLMKARGLKQEGVSAYIYTGAYQVPTPTMLGDVGKDIAMIDEVIGTGEIALSDHRSSTPTVSELIRLAVHSRIGGMLGNKAGIVNIHMGDAKNPFQPLYDAVEMSELTLKQFLPTHCNRNDHIFEDAKHYGKNGFVDLTTSSYPYFPDDEIKPSKAIRELLKAGVPLSHITMSSDGCGSLPQFDENGNIVKLETGSLVSMSDELRDAVLTENLNLEKALQTVTSNVASILKLPAKGSIAVGKDADLVIIDSDFQIVHLCAMGSMMIRNSQLLRKGPYEK